MTIHYFQITVIICWWKFEKTLSKESLVGSVPTTDAALPRWSSILILWRRNSIALGSPEFKHSFSYSIEKLFPILSPSPKCFQCDRNEVVVHWQMRVLSLFPRFDGGGSGPDLRLIRMCLLTYQSPWRPKPHSFCHLFLSLSVSYATFHATGDCCIVYEPYFERGL